jgi:PAS domain S-box-containing protein
MDAVARRAGLGVRYRFAKPWQEIEDLVLAGEADLIPLRAVNGRTQARFAFTHRLDVSPVNYIVRASDAAATAAAPGARIGAIQGSTAHEILLESPGKDLALYDSMQHLLMDLLTGQIDAALTVTENFLSLAAEADFGERFRVLSPPVREITRAIALRPGRDDLVARLDQAVEDFHQSPEAQVIYRKWLEPKRSWWTVRRVTLFLGGASALVVLLVFAWHYLTLRRVNRRLADDQVFLRTLLDAMPFPVFYKDLDLRYLSCNRAFEDLVGKARGDILGKSLHDLWPRELADQYQRADLDLLSGAEGPVQVYEAPMPDRHGVNRQVRFHKATFQTAEGGTGGIIGALVDITERKSSEQALGLLHQRLQKAQSVGRVGSWELDLAQRAMWASEEAFRIYGLEINPAQSLPLEQTQRIPLLEERPRLDLALKNLISGQAPYDLEFAIGRACDGAVRVVHSMAEVIADAQGRPIKVAGTIQDITERKQAEEALRESEARYRTLVEDSVDGIFVQRGSRIVFANRRLYEMLGYEQGALVDQEHWVLYHPDYRELTRGRSQARLRGEDVTSRYEVAALRRDGSSFPAEVSAKVITLSGEAGIQVLVRDVTERKRAEQESRINSERLAALVRLNQLQDASLEQLAAFALEEGVRLTGSEIGYVAFANEDETVLTMHAWSESAMRACAVQDKPLTYFIRDTGLWGDPIRQRRPVITNDYQAANQAKKGLPAGHVEVRRHVGVPIFDGQRIVILAGLGNKAEEYDDNDVRQLTLLMEGMWRIVERQRADQDRLKLEAQLRQAQKMEAIGTLAGGIAHDFNNILGVIMGFAELAQEMASQGEDNSKELGQVLSATERARRLVQQILTFGRKVDADQRPLDLNRSLRQTLEMLRSTLPRMIAIETHLAEDLGRIDADPVQMEQILLNLATNAADAMPQGGRLVIETRNVALDADYCRLHPEARSGPHVLLMISDTGGGMDPRTVEQIFNPFFTTKDIGKGTGLGLSMVYGIVTAHGGSIQCYSEPGLGTTFKIYLPQRPDGAPVPARETAPPVEVAGGHERILLVDDEEALRELGAQTLAEMGYQVLTAASGEQALDIYRAQGREIGLVILDLGMPGMGGHRCLEAILALAPGAKVLIASGYSANGQVKASLQSGAAGFVAKPFRRLDLLLTVRDVLDT